MRKTAEVRIHLYASEHALYRYSRYILYAVYYIGYTITDATKQAFDDELPLFLFYILD